MIVLSREEPCQAQVLSLYTQLSEAILIGMGSEGILPGDEYHEVSRATLGGGALRFSDSAPDFESLAEQWIRLTRRSDAVPGTDFP